MTPELIVAIISAVLTTIVGILTIMANVKMNKLKNLEMIHKYNKNITNFELQFKDEKWFRNLMKNDEFRTYNIESQVRIEAWWEEYQKTNVIQETVPTVEIKTLRKSKPKNNYGKRFRISPQLRKAPTETTIVDEDGTDW